MLEKLRGNIKYLIFTITKCNYYFNIIIFISSSQSMKVWRAGQLSAWFQLRPRRYLRSTSTYANFKLAITRTHRGQGTWPATWGVPWQTISQHRFLDYEACLFSSLRSIRPLVGAATHTPLRRSVVITPFTALRPEDDERSAPSVASNRAKLETLYFTLPGFFAFNSTPNSRYSVHLRAYITVMMVRWFCNH